jgi:hypothetical protein
LYLNYRIEEVQEQVFKDATDFYCNEGGNDAIFSNETPVKSSHSPYDVFAYENVVQQTNATILKDCD